MTRAMQRITKALLLLLALHSATAATRYVDVNSPNPTPPFTNWATAARVIQDALDATDAGDEVLVTNGVYATGGRAGRSGPNGERRTTNRVAVTESLTLRSVNGPELTVIQGYGVPGTGRGDTAIRCVYLADGAVLSGFTIVNGATTTYDPDSGCGGVHCESTNALVTNCILTSNWGGGTLRGTVNNCAFTRNNGGAIYSILNKCTLTRNGALSGGGAYGCILNHCILTGNSASSYGGGAIRSTLNACVLTGNWAVDAGGGAFQSALNNCIVYFNTNYDCLDCSLTNCCTTPVFNTGVGNITNEPAFVDLAGGDLRLRPDSPCINAGNNAYVSGTTDLDGNPRIVGATMDIGAYEFQTPTSLLSYAWAQQYGLPTDGSADFTDNDADALNNWQEWHAGTIPTNALSVLRLLTPVSEGTNLTVTWESVVGRSYFLERSAEVSETSTFTRFATNISAQTNTTSFLDTNAVGASPRFYRVGVE